MRQPNSRVDCSNRLATLTTSPTAVNSTRRSPPRLPTTTRPKWTPRETESEAGSALAPLAVPAFDLVSHREGAVHRAKGGVLLVLQSTECRHQPVAQELVERAAVAKDDPSAALLKGPQQGKGALRRETFAQPREADNVGEQNGHLPRRRPPKLRGRRSCERVGHVGRDVAGEVSAEDFGAHMCPKVCTAAVDGGRQQHGQDESGDGLHQPLRQADVGRAEKQREQTLVGPLRDDVAVAHGIRNE